MTLSWHVDRRVILEIYRFCFNSITIGRDSKDSLIGKGQTFEKKENPGKMHIAVKIISLYEESRKYCTILINLFYEHNS